MDTPLPIRLIEHIRSCRLFPHPGRALVAVSGGPDSVALLLLLHRVAEDAALDIVVGHVDHGILHGSGEVASRVSDLARRLHVPSDGRSLAMGPNTSETRARRARYHALRDMQHAAGCEYLVTAHHFDDQVETVMLRVMRGSGVAGLAGIPAVGRHGLVRPLLAFTKREIGAWLQHDPAAQNLAGLVHDDPSNTDQRHDRSWVREVLLPLLRERFGEGVGRAVRDLSVNAAEDRVAWSALLRELSQLEMRITPGSVQVARAPLHHYDPKLSLALLRAAAREIGCVLGPERARNIWPLVRNAPSGRTFELGNGWVLETIFQKLQIRRIQDTVQKQSCQSEWGSSAAGEVQWGAWSISWNTAEAEAVDRASLVTWATPGEGQIRAPTPGDRMSPLRGGGRRKVSRLLMEGKVPWPERTSYPMLVRGNAILWLPGVCRSDDDVPPIGSRAVRIDARRN